MSNVAQLKAMRGKVKGSLTRAKGYLDALDGANVDLFQIRARKEALVAKLQEFEDVQAKIESADESSEQGEEREQFEEAYFSVLARFERLLSPSALSSAADSSGCGQQIRLPKIELPRFHGSYEEWYEFYDTFNSLIHGNNTLTPVQKFHYLKSSLKGDAAAVISSLEISGINYIEAWNLLKERYDNKRFVIYTHSRAIMDIPPLQRENRTALRQLVDTVLKHTRALKALHRPVDQWDDWIVPLLTSKVDPTTNKQWEETLSSSSLPTFSDLMEFLAQRCQILEAVAVRPMSISASVAKTAKLPRVGVSTHISTSTMVCAICDGSHLIFKCEKLIQMTVQQRIRAIRAKGLCLNCLRSKSHFASSCKSDGCGICGKPHNNMLHISNDASGGSSFVSGESAASQDGASVTAAACASPRGAPSEVYLSTALVTVYDNSGRPLTARAVLDSGSQSSFITENLARRLGGRGRRVTLPIDCIDGAVTQSRQMMSVKFESRHNKFNRTIECFVLRKITQDLPNAPMKREGLRIPANLKLADPTFHEAGRIDLLIGAECFYELHCIGQIKASERHPLLQKTQLGWILSGRMPGSCAPGGRVSCNLVTNNLDALLVKLWQLDDYGDRRALTSESRECKAHFVQNHRRDANGRFVVKLPVVEGEISSLGESRSTAVKRFLNLERKLDKKPALKEEYAKFMQEYLRLGHMKAVNDSIPVQMPYYLPHHAVFKESSITTKMRVVFDASCKTSTGISLNDVLKVSPTIQQDLFSIVARFRTFAYVVTADVTKMYRQILVDESQTSLQRIIWRDHKDEPLQTFELATVTYGTAPASFLATRCLHEIARLERDKHPKAAAVVERDFYVDDLLTGANSISDTIKIRDQVIGMLSLAGFELRKWSANAPELLVGIKNATDENLILDRDNVNTLGIQWNPVQDLFLYSIPPTRDDRITKRGILSSVARLFDPLGLLGPVVIVAKILLQQLWKEGLDWDESVPLAVSTRWHCYATHLISLNDLHIRRRVIKENATRVYLYGFADASEEAYGACVYAVSGRDGEPLSGALICAKSRVAPLRSTSIPRLELCGALLLARLMKQVIAALDVRILGVYCLSDSSVALAWIKSQSRTWTTFVANRVVEIQELLPDASWGHVPTQLNPADIISRGATPAEIARCALWWDGPSAVFNEPADEESVLVSCTPDEIPERRHAVVAGASSVSEARESVMNMFERFSSFTRLIRVTAFCLRFARNTVSQKSDRATGALSVQEIDRARLALIRLCQSTTFGEEMRSLDRKVDLKRNNRLIALSPFMDSDGFLRVGGRLKMSNLPYASKHPLLLPKSHPLTTLIIEHEHVRHLHAGPQLTLAAIRANYWPISGRSCVRSVVKKCVICFRNKPVSPKYLMGDLPKHRVTPSRPFERVGVDYCGPFVIREGRRRNCKTSKAYVAIFVCMTTKAAHIELVSDMTTEAFLAALKRFMARRGRPNHIYSDNGTNFVGADRELGDMWKEVFGGDNGSKTIELITEQGPTWHFIPPGAPHFGGLWEAAVKSAKHHLRRTAGNASLRFEELYTLLTQVEAVLNSRPLTTLSNDPNDLSCLTPGHFLIGDSLLSTAESDLKQVLDNHLSRWQHLEKIRQHFWQRWSAEYLNGLHQRPKRGTATDQPIQEGCMVVVREDHLPPLRWLLGRVEKALPGSDGIVRAVLVKTTKGTLKRPATRLCLLPRQ